MRFLTLLFVLALVPLAGCRTQSESRCDGEEVRLTTPGKLTVAADYSYPPFAFRSRDNDLIGSEVDVAKAIAAELKLEAAFVNRGTGALITGLIAHRHDIAASGFRDSTRLQEEACPSAPYLAADLGVLVWETNPQAIASVDDLAGRKVSVLNDSDAEDWALDHLDSSTITSLPTTDDLLTALQQGSSDAVVADLPFARFSAQESDAFRVAATAGTGEDYVLVGAADNGPLMESVDAALGRLREKGTLRKIEEKWFGSADEPARSSPDAQ